MSSVLELIITIFLGIWGVHRFMKKDFKMGLLYLFTMGLLGIGWVIDIAKAFRKLTDEIDLDDGSYKGTKIRVATWSVVIFLFISGNSESTGLGLFVLAIYLLLSWNRYKTNIKEMIDIRIREKDKDYLISEVEEKGLISIEVEDLVTSADEVCYLVEEAKIEYSEENDTVRRYKRGKFYITSKRVVLYSTLSEFDRLLSDITYINSVSSDVLVIKFKDKSYGLIVKNADKTAIILRKVLKQSHLDNGETVCEYCGCSNILSDKYCYNCNAPLKKPNKL